jgi:integrase
MSLRLTPRNLLTLPPGPGDLYADYHDAEIPGLMVRVKALPSGDVRRFYALRYRVAGLRRRYHLGNARAISLEKARQAARAILGDVARGHDPRQQRSEARLAAEAGRKARKAGGTVASLVKRFLEARKRDLRANTLLNWRGLLSNHIEGSDLGRIAPADVKRRDVRELLERIGKTYPYSANRVLELVRVAFAWAVEREELKATPCTGLKKLPETPRERALSHDEVRRVLLALDVEETGEPSEELTRLAREAEARANGTAPAADETAPPLAPHPLEAAAWRLLFLTGLRIKEVLNAPWPEVDFASRRWTIPAERMKGARAHVVPLSKAILEVLATLRELPSPWVVQSPVDPSKPLAALAPSLQRIKALSGTSGWSAHDLRRTLRTELSALGVGLEVKELILAHRLPALVGVYDQHSFLTERAAALEAWAAALARIKSGEETKGAEVVPISRGRAVPR